MLCILLDARSFGLRLTVIDVALPALKFCRFQLAMLMKVKVPYSRILKVATGYHISPLKVLSRNTKEAIYGEQGQKYIRTLKHSVKKLLRAASQLFKARSVISQNVCNIHNKGIAAEGIRYTSTRCVMALEVGLFAVYSVNRLEVYFEFPAPS